MYCDHRVNLSDAGREYLTQKEAELGVPIRFMAGRGRTWPNSEWTDEQAAACGNATVEDAAERGITIVDYSTLQAATTYDRIEIPPVLAFDEHYNNWDVHDVFVVPDRMLRAEPIQIGGVNLGEVGDRIITLALACGGWLDISVLKADVLLDDALKRCIDEQFIAGLVEARETFARDAFLDYAENTGQEGITNIRREVDRWASTLEGHTRQIALAKLKLREQQQILDAVLDNQDEDNTRASRLEQWEMLNNDPRIASIAFDPDDNTVTIETNGTNLIHPLDGREVYLGKFRWTIGIADGTVHVVNIDNQHGGFDHPHVYMNRPCFGDMGETITTFVMQGRLHPAVDMIFVFLGSVQLRDDYGRRAAFWFEQDELVAA